MKKSNKTLAQERPDVWKIWHPEKNGKLTPDKVDLQSTEEHWYMCNKNHSWRDSVKEISKGSSCPFCKFKKVKPENCLANVKPEIAKQWHPTKNKGVTPNDVSANSSVKVWWLCPRGHDYEVPPNNRRSVNTGCSQCSKELHTSFPEQSMYFYLKKVFVEVENRIKIKASNNKLYELDIFIPSLKLGIEYDGIYHNSKTAQKRDELKNKMLSLKDIKLIRFREGKLPKLKNFNSISFLLKGNSHNELTNAIKWLRGFIVDNYKLSASQSQTLSNLKINVKDDAIEIMNEYIERVKENSLAEKFPELIKEWHPTKNRNLKPEYFTPFTTKKVWWLCKEGHEWCVAISNRTIGGNGCKYCAGQAVTKETSLASRFPNIAIQWDYSKNNSSPFSVMPGSTKEVWWLCKKEHSFKMMINKKVNSGFSCPICIGKRVTLDNCLAVVNPELAKEWHPTKNGKDTPMEYTAGSSTKKFWWRCKENPEHEWECTIYKRHKRNFGCPYCTGKRVTKQNSLANLSPELAKEWHPTKNNPDTPETVFLNSNNKAWWLCPICKYEWNSIIKSRTKRGKIVGGCPNCSTSKATEGKNLEAQFPELVKDWDYIKNEKLPNEYVKGSSIKVWWKCKHNHEEKEQIRYRVRRNGCSQCKKMKL